MRLPARLLRRKVDSHKGDFGHVLVLAGSRRLSGAGVLAAEAALRSGAGLVTLGIPQEINPQVIKIKLKEIMTLPLPGTKEGTLALKGYGRIERFCEGVNVVAIGPGLSRNSQTQALVHKIVRGLDKFLVIDADGLNALAGHAGLLRRNKVIITPHPGEMSRLTGLSIRYIQADRSAVAARFAKDYKVTVVLKGAGTVVAGPDGKLYINKTGNAGMAKAGSGDVLTGMIAAFLGQGLTAFTASKYAVYLHGLAGDLAAKEKTKISLIASDIIAKIPQAIKKCG